MRSQTPGAASCGRYSPACKDPTVHTGRAGLTQYLGRVCNVVPVGGWKLQLSSQDLVKEIFLEIVLTSDKKWKNKSQRMSEQQEGVQALWFGHVTAQFCVIATW